MVVAGDGIFLWAAPGDAPSDICTASSEDREVVLIIGRAPALFWKLSRWGAGQPR